MTNIVECKGIRALCIYKILMEEKKKMKSNTAEDYNQVSASEDPTNISKEEQERLTLEAIKKFKTLS